MALVFQASRAFATVVPSLISGALAPACVMGTKVITCAFTCTASLGAPKAAVAKVTPKSTIVAKAVPKSTVVAKATPKSTAVVKAAAAKAKVGVTATSSKITTTSKKAKPAPKALSPTKRPTGTKASTAKKATSNKAAASRKASSKTLAAQTKAKAAAKKAAKKKTRIPRAPNAFMLFVKDKMTLPQYSSMRPMSAAVKAIAEEYKAAKATPGFQKYITEANRLKEETAKKRAAHAASIPKKPATKFALYVKDRFTAIKMQNPGMKASEVAKLLAQEWRAMNEADKDKYNPKAA